MAQAALSGLGLEPRKLRRLLLNRQSRREGSLAAALVQSMALAVISTAGAYPSWVLVTSKRQQVVLGAAWAISQADPPRRSPVLGPSGGPLMMAIAFCCLCSVLTGATAIGLDFLGRRHGRRLAPLLHGLTAVLITCASAFGSSLLGLMRGRTRREPELQPLNFRVTPGQSLFLSFLACALAATATGLSCSSPALVAPARSSRDLGRVGRRRDSSRTDSDDSPVPSPKYYPWQDDRFLDSLDNDSSSQDDGERPGPAEWVGYVRRELPQTLWRWSSRKKPQPASPAGETCCSGEEGAAGKSRGPQPLPQRGILGGLLLPRFGEKERGREDPGRSGAELQVSLQSENEK
uniref:Uncharacterized protein n=1 Tax=Sphaerodactylus townsendi TaxID=933632 RepID=A0ACB8FB62_9SAUR